MNELWDTVLKNVIFVLEFLAVIVVTFGLAYLIERLTAGKRTGKVLKTRTIAMVGMFSAIALILYLFDFPLPFAPEFYKVDLSELPILVGTFAFGPVAGVMMECCKVLLKLVVKGTTTAFVGDLANFMVGCSLILPASAIYEWKRTKKAAVGAVIAGSLCMTIFGTMLNAIYLLPTFSKLYGVPLEQFIAMGSAINSGITDLTTFVIFAVAPLNILKSGAVSILTLLVYKPLSPILKSGRQSLPTVSKA